MAVTTGTNYCTLEMVTRAKTDLIIILFEINIWITQKNVNSLMKPKPKGLLKRSLLPEPKWQLQMSAHTNAVAFSDNLAVLESRALTRHLTFSNPDPSQDHVISKSAYVTFFNRCDKCCQYRMFGLL